MTFRILFFTINLILITLFGISCIADEKVDSVDFFKSKGAYFENNNKAIEFLDNSTITDDDLKHLIELPNTEVLSIHTKNITSKGFQYLKYLKNLRVIFLNNSNFDDKSMKYLEGLNNLRRLELRNTKITGEGLKYIQNLQKLQDLFIANNNITDNGLKYLEKLENLISLELYGTKVTKENVSKFWKKAPNPELVIDMEGPDPSRKGE